MPHGWWRILVEPDGSGTMAFGALPYSGAFPAGTIDHASICSVLRSKVNETRETLSDPIGTINFVADDDSGHLWYFNDWGTASELFELAWKNKEEPKTDIEKKHIEALAKFWDNRELPNE